MKLGIIGQPYNCGLGNISWGFAEHFNSKTLLVHRKAFAIFPERFKEYRLTKEITREDIEWLMDGIDVLLTIESPYDWSVYTEARKRGIRTILMPMYEWSDMGRIDDIDLIICPSLTTYREVKGNKYFVPSEVPVDLRRFKGRVVSKARTFLHNSGHGGHLERNSTMELLRAIPDVKSDVRFVIRSQYPLNVPNDSRIKYIEGNIRNYWDLYAKGDVYVLLGKYGVAYLGIQEAMACGMPIMFSDISPFNEYLPQELLVKPRETINTRFQGKIIPMAYFDSKDIAKKIDEISSMDLTRYSEHSLCLAKKWSWDVWQKKYEELFNGLIKGEIPIQTEEDIKSYLDVL